MGLTRAHQKHPLLVRESGDRMGQIAYEDFDQDTSASTVI